MKTKLATLCGILMMVGCGADMTESPDREWPVAGDLEEVFLDYSDVDSAEERQQPQVDPDGDYPIAEVAMSDAEGGQRPQIDPDGDYPIAEAAGDSAEKGQRPQIDPDGDYQIAEAAIARPGDEDAALRFPGVPQIPGGDQVERLPSNPCDCPDQKCREKWIDDNLGCNVCVTFGCSQDRRTGACHRCQ